MLRVERGAVLAIVGVALASGCAREPSAVMPSPTPAIAPTAVSTATVPADVEARLLRLKAELAVTRHFCSLEDRPCRAQKRAAIDRGVAALLMRCASGPRRTFDRCLATELPVVLGELPSPAPDDGAASPTALASPPSSHVRSLPPATAP
jgi:hypothetical protein